MEELIKTFHIEWHLLIAQVVNFGIVLAVLWKFALKPLQKVLQERQSHIESSLQKAEQIERDLANAKSEQTNMIAAAKQQAHKILKETQIQADEKRQAVLAQTNAQAAKIVAEAKKTIAVERQKMFGELKSQLGDLVVLATGKILGQKVNARADEELIRKSLELE